MDIYMKIEFVAIVFFKSNDQSALKIINYLSIFKRYTLWKRILTIKIIKSTEAILNSKSR
jgi:hypothetical protein